MENNERTSTAGKQGVRAAASVRFNLLVTGWMWLGANKIAGRNHRWMGSVTGIMQLSCRTGPHLLFSLHKEIRGEKRKKGTYRKSDAETKRWSAQISRLEEE